MSVTIRMIEKKLTPWGGFLLSLLLASPFIALGVRAINVSSFSASLLSYALLETIILVVGTLIFATLIALPLAGLLAFTDVRGKRLLFIAACLPLAFPPYLTAFCWGDMADGLGFIQQAFRSLTGYQLRRDYWFPEIRSMGGAIFVFTLALYPYIFIAAYVAFQNTGRKLTDAALTLGATPLQAFRRIALKLIKPTLIASSLPVAFETLNDIAVAKISGIITLPLYIMSIWLEKNNAALAALLSLGLIAMLILVMLYFIKSNFSVTPERSSTPLFTLSNKMKVITTFIIVIPCFLGFIMPLFYLLSLAGQNIPKLSQLMPVLTTIKLALFVTITTLCSAFLLYFAARRLSYFTLPEKLASLSYALPGSILGLAMMSVLSVFYLFGTVTGLVFALSLRFITLAYEQLKAAGGKTIKLTNAARTLGATPFTAFYAIEWPVLKPTVYVAGLLIAVETVKELPLTLMLRPVGFETIALTLFETAERGALSEMAIPAVFLVLCCLIPVWHLVQRLYTSHV
jgi:iron(III) transport system permease protein